MSLGFTEILFLMLIVLLFFGPNRLPGVGKTLGQAIRSFKKSFDGAEIDVTEKSQKVSKKDNEQSSDT